MTMNRPIHFELQASAPEKLAEFYSGIFGWKFHKWEGPMEYWLIDTGTDQPGLNGGMLPRKGPVGTVVTVDVANLATTLEKVKAAGGQVVLAPMEVPGVGTLAYIKDPEETIWGVLQPVSASGS
jgi:hypothetical protein